MEAQKAREEAEAAAREIINDLICRLAPEKGFICQSVTTDEVSSEDSDSEDSANTDSEELESDDFEEAVECSSCDHEVHEQHVYYDCEPLLSYVNSAASAVEGLQLDDTDEDNEDDRDEDRSLIPPELADDIRTILRHDLAVIEAINMDRVLESIPRMEDPESLIINAVEINAEEYGTNKDEAVAEEGEDNSIEAVII